MKFLLISNGDLAKEMYRSMEGFYSDPDIDVICLKADKDQFIRDLKAYVCGGDEEILVVCDAFGSTAFNEALYLINRYGLGNRVGLLCGMNLPMTFKLYGLKDQWNMQNIMSLYNGDEGAWSGRACYYAPAV